MNSDLINSSFTIKDIADVTPTQRIAMLIDGDNAQPSLIDKILAETTKYGLITNLFMKNIHAGGKYHQQHEKPHGDLERYPKDKYVHLRHRTGDETQPDLGKQQ